MAITEHHNSFNKHSELTTQRFSRGTSTGTRHRLPLFFDEKCRSHYLAACVLCTRFVTREMNNSQSLKPGLQRVSITKLVLSIIAIPRIYSSHMCMLWERKFGQIQSVMPFWKLWKHFLFAGTCSREYVLVFWRVVRDRKLSTTSGLVSGVAFGRSYSDVVQNMQYTIANVVWSITLLLLHWWRRQNTFLLWIASQSLKIAVESWSSSLFNFRRVSTSLRRIIS